MQKSLATFMFGGFTYFPAVLPQSKKGLKKECFGTEKRKHLTFPCWVLFLCEQRGNPKKRKSDIFLSGFSYKEQYAVVVICKDEKEQENIYNRLKEEGFKLKVVAV